MKSHTKIRRSTATILLAFAAASTVHAVVTPAVPPVLLNWKTIADTCTTALGPCPAASPIGRFNNFAPPVMPQYDGPLCAFKAWVQPGNNTAGLVITPANDEGVWSNGPDWAAGSFTGILTNVVREGDPVPSSLNTFGFANALSVQNLQMSAGGVTICENNTSVPAGKVGVMDNCCLQNLGESPSSSLMDIRPPVIDLFNANIGMWKRKVGGLSGVEHGALPGYIMPPCIPPANNWRSGFAATWATNQIPRVGSPSISESGWIALYGRDMIFPVASRNHIRVVDTVGTPTIIIRQNQVSPPVPVISPAGSRFGIIHTQLMANTDYRNTSGITSNLVAWQMDTMTAPGPTTIGLDSLWCKQGGIYNCLSYVSQPAVDIPGRTIASFYALHAIANPFGTNSSWVVWGAQLNPVPGPVRVAIYGCLVTGGVMGPVNLIATDVPAITPVLTPLSGPQNITTIARFFSVNARGDVLFKATCAGAPPARRQVLVTAGAAAGHPLSVRAQSSMGLLSSGCGPVIINNFQLTTPDQGVYSRGQALNGLGMIAAKILYTTTVTPFTGGQGVYIGQ